MRTHTMKMGLLLIVLGLSACGGGNKTSQSDYIASSSLASVASSSVSSSVTATLSSSSSLSSSDASSSALSSSSTPAFLMVTGLVVDDSALPIEGAIVSLVGSNHQATTLADGTFNIELSTSTPAVLRVEKVGYSGTLKAAEAPDLNQAIAARIVMPRVVSTQTFDPTQPAVLRVPGSPARVDLAAGSLVREDGQAISGPTSVALTPIDPSVDIARMPGLLVDAASGEPIESLGALTVNFTDASGAPLNLASGQTATIRIPATPAAGATLPATFPLYHLNETSGRWTQEGTATLRTDLATGDKYYEGTVSHFSTWNADQPLTRTSLDLSTTLSGSPCPAPVGVRLEAVGVDYNGVTAPEGNNFFARVNSRVQLRLVDAGGKVVDALDMTTGEAGGSVRPSRCLSAQQNVQLSGKVVVSSGSLTGYRVQISGDFPSFTLPIDTAGRYSTSIYRSAGAVQARLVHDTRRPLPDTIVSTTVAGSNVELGDLNVTDTIAQISGCLQGWAGYRASSAQVSVWRGSTLLAAPFTATATDSNFVFSVPIQSSLSLRITPPDASLAERVVNLSVGNTPPDLSTCLALPRGPQVQASSSGSGLVRSFDASATTPGDAAITTFVWDFGDGGSGSGSVVSHTYASEGTFTVRLTVSDALGQRSVFSLTPDTSGGTTYSTLTAATTLSVDSRNSCVIRDGSPWCWGYNGSQALGRSYNAVRVGSTDVYSGLESSGVPVQISVGLTSATAVVNGDAHACALNANGTVQCWGSGVLGDGVSEKSVTPVTVSGISSAKAISGSDYATCAVLANGTVRCWGNSSVGAPPVAVDGISDAVGVAAIGGTFGGKGDGCAVLASGGVRCWGDNGYGRLGNGSEVDSAISVPVSGVSTAVAVAAGDRNSCALLADGTVACWGEYSGGWFKNVLDHGPGGPAITVPGVSNAVALSMHGSRSCAVLANGSVMCWAPSAGAAAVAQAALSGVVSLALGQGHTCALLGSGGVRCWGGNGNGQLGTGGQVFRVDGVVQNPPTYENTATPVDVVGLP